MKIKKKDYKKNGLINFKKNKIEKKEKKIYLRTSVTSIQGGPVPKQKLLKKFFCEKERFVKSKKKKNLLSVAERKKIKKYQVILD